MKPLSAAQALAHMKAGERTPKPKPQRLAPGLYLTPQPRAGRVVWIALLRWSMNGKEDSKSLGTYDRSRHADYLASAEQSREARREGLNPHAVVGGGDGAPGTFQEAAADFLKTVEAGVTKYGASRKNATNVKACVERSCRKLGHLQLTAISPRDIRRALPDLTKIPSARRALARIAKIIDRGYALAQIHDRANPADWKRAQHYVEELSKRHRVRHFLALSADAVPAAFRELAAVKRNGYRGCGAAALRFLILTGARGREVAQMTWDDLDLDNYRVWTRPAPKMKTREEHEVPLSEPALAILREQKKFARGPHDFVFRGQMMGTGLSVNAIREAMRRTSFGEKATPHGFRSSLASWWRTSEVGRTYPKVLLDDALSHARREEKDTRHGVDEVFAAYDREQLLVERRKFMDDWARFVTGTTTAPLALVAA